MADGIAAPAQRPPGTPDPHETHLTRIVAVRHGETAWNAEMRMQGQLDTALSARGRWQAGRAAESLAGEGIEAIFASDLVRAFDTAQALAARLGLPITTDVGLRERSFGVFQGLHLCRHRPALAGRGGALAASRSRLRARGRRDAARVQRPRGRGLQPHRRQPGRAARSPSSPTAACSTASIAPPPASTLGAPRSWELGNAAINRLLYTPRGFTLVGWSDTAHLEGEMTLDDGSEGDPAMPVGPGAAMSAPAGAGRAEGRRPGRRRSTRRRW